MAPAVLRVPYNQSRGESCQTSTSNSILEEFPLLDRMSRVYGAIAFYLDHKDEIDKYLEETEREFEASGIPMKQADPALWERIQRARSKIGESHR